MTAGQLYRLMVESRIAEESIGRLWRDGLVSGDMHMSMGEEAIIAGVVSA